MGATRPLKTNVPYLRSDTNLLDSYTSIPKPATCSKENGKTSFSHPSPRLTTQMPSVRQVSIVLRVVALTREVTLSPKKLKAPMENMMAKQDPRTVGVEMICLQPRGMSK